MYWVYYQLSNKEYLMSDPIQDAIDAAKKTAGETLPSTQNQNTAVSTPVSRGAPLALDDMLGGTISVDAWIKVSEFGLQIGTDRTLFESLPVTLDMSAIAYNYQVRYGNPVTYIKSYDRQVDSRGGSWVQAIAKAQKIDQKASEYRSADIPFVLREDIKSKDGKTVIITKGSTVGHSLSITGWKSFGEFVNKLKKDGIDPNNAVVDLDLSFTVRTNSSGTWGVLAFTNFEEKNLG